MIYQDSKGHNAVFGIFESRIDLESCVDRLKLAGFNNSDISVLLPDASGNQNFAHQKGTKAPEGVSTGATGGLALGGVLGWLAGVGALAIPGVGPLVAAGPILAAITGAGVGGALGGIAGGLIGMGIPEYEAKRFETHVRDGGFLMSVHVADSTWAKKAKDIMDANGGTGIATASESTDGIPDQYRKDTPPTVTNPYDRMSL